jgi:6-phosphogluconolactonase
MRHLVAAASIALTALLGGCHNDGSDAGGKITPTITWASPSPVTYGTALSATQLDATASVAGSFVYTPPASTVLSPGAQTLSVAFTPSDSTNYTTASATVSMTVNPAGGSGTGPVGGTVNGFYGASVTIPAGALSSTIDIEILRDSTGAPTLPSTGIDTAGAMYALTPHGTAFSLPATVQIPFDSARIPTDATPVIYKAEPGGAFAPISTTVSGNMLSASVSNFSWVIPGFASTLPRMVYALTRADVSGTSTVSVSSFKIGGGTGELSAATSSAAVGGGAISVTVHPSRRFAYVTNGSLATHGAAPNVPANSISVYQLDPVTGAISGPTDTKPVNGNPISVVVHPTGKFIYVVNEVRFGSTIGNISAFSIDSTTGALTSLGATADLGGVPATALAFAPSGEFAYVTYIPPDPQSNNNFDTVKTFAVSANGLFSSNPIGSAPTGDNPWALVVTPGGHFAYVASIGVQGSVDQLSSYSINQTTGVLHLLNSFSISTASGQSPLSLAMDSEGRFLYVGIQGPVFFPPSSNFNLHVYSIDPNSGTLSFASGAATASNPQGPISVVAEPQAQFVYVMDGNAELEAFKVGSNGTLTLSGNPLGGVFNGGATGGVGDPFFFAASGTSPVWEDFCTIIIDNAFAFDGCPFLARFAGPGSGGGGGGANPPPPAATFVLQVLIDTTGGSVLSSPAGIDYDPATGQNFFQHAFPNGSLVTLTATPPDSVNAYDVKWTGACSGTALTAHVGMSQDQHCYVSFTPTSLR